MPPVKITSNAQIPHGERWVRAPTSRPGHWPAGQHPVGDEIGTVGSSVCFLRATEVRRVPIDRQAWQGRTPPRGQTGALDPRIARSCNVASILDAKLRLASVWTMLSRGVRLMILRYVPLSTGAARGRLRDFELVHAAFGGVDPTVAVEDR